jgi:tungstate transport system substrate-binding protein
MLNPDPKYIRILYLLLMVAITMLLPTAQPMWAQTQCEQTVIVQADDWLSKIAEKVYGQALTYPAIEAATNAKHAEDATFAQINHADTIEIGWKLCLPSAAEVETWLNRPVTATTTVVASLVQPTGEQVGRLVLATTTSTADSGLLAAILPDFETRYGAKVEVIAVGTGQAIALGEKGDADVLLVHARSQEDAFMAAGFGVNRQDVMYNDFVLIGPPTDPAGLKGMTDVATALVKLAETKSSFISRGDNSGTHTKEQSLWKSTPLSLVETPGLPDGKPFMRPQGDWYNSIGQGMGATLTMANEQQAYTLSDRATYLTRKQNGLNLDILVEGDSRLFNPYGVIAVNPAQHAGVNAKGATAFIQWITSIETQQLISQFGLAQFGQSLFTPDSAAWHQRQP